MNKKYIYFAIISIFCGFYAFSAFESQFPLFDKEVVTIHTESGESAFNTELALNTQQKEYGLMYRKELGEDKAMLFIFNNVPVVNMWMKNTLISLDMLFIDSAGKIVYIKHDAKPESLDNISAGAEPVKAVMEIQGGLARKKHINVGDKVNYKAFKQ